MHGWARGMCWTHAIENECEYPHKAMKKEHVERVERVHQKKSKKFCKPLGSDAVEDADSDTQKEHDEEDFYEGTEFDEPDLCYHHARKKGLKEPTKKNKPGVQAKIKVKKEANDDAEKKKGVKKKVKVKKEPNDDAEKKKGVKKKVKVKKEPKPWFDEVTQLDSQEGHDADYEYLMDCFQAVHEDGERLCNLNCHLAGEEFEDENGVQRIEPHLWEDLQLPVSHRTVTVVPQAVELLDVDKYMLKIYGHIAERVENVSQKKSKKFCKLLGSDAVNDLDHDEEDFDIYIYIYI